MTAIASNGWSAVVSAGGPDITVGMAVTLDSSGARMVPATTANVTASPSGVIEGIAVTPGSSLQGIIVMAAGRLAPLQVPLVGTGAVEFAVIDAAGSIVRSATYTANAIGITGKDGSVTIMLALYGGLVIGGGSLINIAAVAVTIAAGDGLVNANHASDFTRVTKATEANNALGFIPTGIALTGANSPGTIVYAGPGTEVLAATIGLSPTGTSSWAILDPVTGRVIRKKNPTPSDVFIGVVNQQGNLLILQSQFETSQLNLGLPPYSSDSTGIVGISDMLRQAIADANIAGGGMQLNAAGKEVRIPQGLWLPDKPIHIKTPGVAIRGEGRLTSHLRQTSWVGPIFHIAADIGQYPTVANAGIGGGNALRVEKKPQVQNEHWLELSECGAGTDANGKGTFSVEMIVTMLATTTLTGALVIASFGERLATDGVDNEGWGVGYAGSTGAISPNAFYFSLTTTVGGLTTIFATTGTSVIGTQYTVQCTYDGANMRIFINGTQQAIGAKTGTIVQGFWETVNLNGQYQYYLSLRKYSSADFDLASLRISANARSGLNQAAKYTEDTSTMLLINADLFDGVFVKGRARPTTTATSCVDAYFPHRFDNVGAVGGMTDVIISDMAITNLYGTAINGNTGFNMVIRDMTIQAKNGLRLDNNCFKTSIANIYLGSTYNAATGNQSRVGISMVGAANVMSAGNIYVSGFDTNFVISGGDVGTWGSWYSTITKGHILIFNSININWLAESEISDEASDLVGKNPDFFVAILTTHLSYWCNYQPSQGGSAGTAPLITIQSDATFGGGKHVFEVAWLKVADGTPGVISCIGAAGTYDVVVRWPFTIVGATAPMVRGTPPVGVKFWFEPKNFAKVTAITMTDANRTVTVNEWLDYMLIVSGTLTATRTLTVPAAAQGSRVISNTTAQILSVVAAGSAAPINLAAGKVGTYVSDGTDLKLIATT